MRQKPRAKISAASAKTTSRKSGQRLLRLYQVLTRITAAIIAEKDRLQLFQSVCAAIVSDRQIQVSYFAALGADQKITAVASAGIALADLAAIELASLTGPKSKGPIGVAFATRRPDVCNDFRSDTRMFPWRELAINKACKATAAFPVVIDGAVDVVLVLGAEEAGYFRADEVSLFAGVCHNLAHALSAMKSADIRREAAEMKERLHRRLSETLENLTEGYYELDRSFRFTYMNAQYQRMFSLSPRDTMGKTVWEIFPEAEPTTHGIVLKEAMQSGQVRILEAHYAPFTRWYEVRVYPTDDGLSVYVRDTTNTHRVEEELRRERERLVHAQAVTKVGSWETDLKTLDVLWSEETFRIFDLDPKVFRPTHIAFLDYVHPDDRDAVDAAFRRSFDSDEVCQISHRIITGKGTTKTVAERWQVFHDAEGNPTRAFGTCQDITEREQAAAENRRLADNLVSTLESITDAFYTLDRDWNFTYVNHEAERLLRRNREALIGRNIWETFSEARDGVFDFQYEYAMRTHEAVHFERFYSPLQMWVDVRVFPSEQGLAVYFRDIGAEVEAKQALQTSETRFRQFAEKIQEIFYVLDAQSGKITYVSPAYEKVWGRTCESLLEHPASYMDFIYPTDRQAVRATLPRIAAGETIDIEYRIVRPDDTIRWIHDYSYPVKNAAGIVDSIVGVSHDITQQKLAEERLLQQASLLDKATDAILVRDLEHCITFWNRSAELLYGWTSAEVIGKKAPEVLYEDPTTFWQAWNRLIEQGEWAGELHQIAKDGRELTIEARWTLLKNSSGIPMSVLAINSDVTERRLLERQSLRAQRLESIGTLAGGIAHDLNNVLTPIMMATGILKKNPDHKRKEMLEIIESSAQRGAEMVAQVLAFARGVEGEQSDIDLNGVLQDIEKIARDTFPKNIGVYTEIAPDLRAIVGDRTQLHQVLLNLCVNARDAMPNGGVITIAANNIDLDESFVAMNRSAAAGPYILVEVADTGTGIDSAIIDRIFDPFFTTKAPGEGTGFGLSTSLAIVKGHRGFITVDSRVGKGSWFRIYLPARKMTATLAATAAAEDIPRGNGEMILLVDDEAAIRRVAAQTLEEFGYRVLTANDGAEGLATFAEHKAEIRAVLSDLMMPVMDGASFVQVLKKMVPELPVIVASGVASETVLNRLAQVGITDFLQKPYTGIKLLNLLHQRLNPR